MIQYPFLVYISIFSPIIPLGIGVSKIFSTSRGMKILFFYIFFAFIVDIYLAWFVRGHQLHLGIVHAYYIIECIFILTIITVWQETVRMKRLFQTLILLYILFWIIAKLTFEPLSGLYSITASASQVLLTLCAGYTLFVVVGNREQSLMNQYRFWVLLSIVIYYAGTLLTIALRGILIHYSTEKFLLFTSLDWSLKIIFNILFTVGFLCPQTRT
jgi:hypothetical protein